MLHSFFNSRIYSWVPQASCVIGIAFLLLFGIQGFLKSAPFGDDFRVFFTAGQLFLSGQNPWVGLQDSGTPFSYPPHSIGFFGLYALLSFDAALTIHSYINLASIIVMAWVLNRWIFRVGNWRQLTLAQLLPLFLLFANFYMATSVFQGQLALPAAAAVLLSWYFLHRERWIIAGILLGLATIKPQLAVLYVLWLLLSWQIKPLLVGGLLSLMLMLPSIFTFGAVESVASWLHSMTYYSQVEINAPGLPYVVGVESLLAAEGIFIGSALFKILALVSLAVLFWQRQRFNEVQIIHLLFVITFTFLYGHDYDYAAVMGLLCHLLYLSMSRATPAHLAITSGILFVFLIPQRFLREFDFALLQHLRTLLLPLAAYFVWQWSKEASEVRKTAPATQIRGAL